MAELQGYPIPVFFSEDGCNTIRPRTFDDMSFIFGENMTPILSGAIVYEWTQAANDYGIIQYPDTAIQDGIHVPVGSPVPMQPEFNNLMSQWAAVSPSSTSAADYTPTTGVFACPAVTPGVWTIRDSQLPPTPETLTPPPVSSVTFGPEPPLPSGPPMTGISGDASMTGGGQSTTIVGVSTASTGTSSSPGLFAVLYY